VSDDSTRSGGTDDAGDRAAETSSDDAPQVLDSLGFDAADSHLTRRQATVLALRERGHTQGAIADRFGTSRANVASIEASARENVAKARETAAFAEALEAPVHVTVAAGTDLYDVPGQVFDACDEAGIKVAATAPELMAQVSDAAGEAVAGREVRRPLVVSVTTDGELGVRVTEEE
jgi:hypothetical protein